MRDGPAEFWTQASRTVDLSVKVECAEGGKPEYPEKNPQSQIEIDKSQPTCWVCLYQLKANQAAVLPNRIIKDRTYEELTWTFFFTARNRLFFACSIGIQATICSTVFRGGVCTRALTCFAPCTTRYSASAPLAPGWPIAVNCQTWEICLMKSWVYKGNKTASCGFLDNNRKRYDVGKHEKSIGENKAKPIFLSAFWVFNSSQCLEMWWYITNLNFSELFPSWSHYWIMAVTVLVIV